MDFLSNEFNCHLKFDHKHLRTGFIKRKGVKTKRNEKRFKKLNYYTKNICDLIYRIHDFIDDLGEGHIGRRVFNP